MPPDPLAEFHDQTPAWTPCEGGLECASVVVPLDYADPGLDRISLAISRRKATGQPRLGVLVANPGGPGGSGLRMPAYLSKTAAAKSYDLIGFDPRGVGDSTALTCRVKPEIATVDSRPPDSEFPKWTAEAHAVEDACQASGGGIRRFVNTESTARDLDVIREVLGEQRINYLGYSYGTYLGAVYGTLFPDRLDRSVLDSSVHPEWLWRQQAKGQAIATRRNVEQWADWAALHDGDLRLGRSGAEVMALVEKASARLAVDPVGGHTRTEFDAAVGVGARYRPLWTELGRIVGGLTTGTDPKAAVEQSARFAAAAAGELQSGVFDTVTCEADWPRDLETYYEDMRVFRDRYPYGLGVLRAAPTACTFRSFTPPGPMVQLKRDGYPVGLVVQAEGDSQTQYEGGPAMASRLGDNLITVLDEGKHGLYASGNACVDAAVDHYLVDGVLPASSSTCPGDPRPDPSRPSERSVESFLDTAGLPGRSTG
ncbi:alpha/beta hydrolase [Umezawaea sp. Da 62-37]|uniref:alpha/beta hydrolase n=1 Tax=Umezawaea sp. Da 62-37 TaxID=3075927 RepID=UPI0028F6EF6F|nr:alpha/beta hydrolase [Umezawaea sp. Da 62-37]WNV83450.1 alpha/beta hydrolase [Umezawaea sp. Da 62-37]